MKTNKLLRTYPGINPVYGYRVAELGWEHGERFEQNIVAFESTDKEEALRNVVDYFGTKLWGKGLNYRIDAFFKQLPTAGYSIIIATGYYRTFSPGTSNWWTKSKGSPKLATAFDEL